MIYDVFMFFNELDLLEIRLEELWDVVDKFVITEATTTHRGQPKKMYYQENIDRFEKYQEKIIHLTMDNLRSENYFKAERVQRNFFLDKMQIQDDDVLILGDVDEIPKSSEIQKYNLPEKMNIHERVFLVQTLHHYYVNYVSTKYKWRGPFMATGKVLREISPVGLRRKTQKGSTRGITCRDGGWHFSYLGGPAEVLYKINNIAHKEEASKSIEITYDNIVSRMNRGESLFDDGIKYELNNNIELPNYLTKNKEKFSHLFYDGS